MSGPQKKIAILLVGHGSRSLDALQSSQEQYLLCRSLIKSGPAQSWASNILPDLFICYLQYSQPDIGTELTSVAQKYRQIIVLPLFLFAATHINEDLPAAIESVQTTNPQVMIQIADPLGVNTRLAELAWLRLQQAGFKSTLAASSAIVYLGRGQSRYPDILSEMTEQALRLQKVSGHPVVRPAWFQKTQPDLPGAIEILYNQGFRYIGIAMHFLFPGRLTAKIAIQVESFRLRYPDLEIVTANVLGPDPVLAQILLEKAQLLAEPTY